MQEQNVALANHLPPNFILSLVILSNRVFVCLKYLEATKKKHALKTSLWKTKVYLQQKIW